MDGNKHMKGSPPPLVIKKMHTKTTMNNELAIPMANKPTLIIPSNSEDVGKRISHHCWWEHRTSQRVENSLANSYKVKYTLPTNPAIPLFGIYPREVNVRSPTNLCANIYSSYLEWPKTRNPNAHLAVNTATHCSVPVQGDATQQCEKQTTETQQVGWISEAVSENRPTRKALY